VAACIVPSQALAAAGLLRPETECIHEGGGGSWRVFMVNGGPGGAEAGARSSSSSSSRSSSIAGGGDGKAALGADGGPGCSPHTPGACRLLASLAALALPRFRALRGGFSVVSERAHLHPHCGVTNAQLKMHLGLIVPTQPHGAHAGASSGHGGGSVGSEGLAVGSAAEHEERHQRGSALQPEPEAVRPCARIRVGNETRAWETGRVLFFDDSWEHEVWHDCGGSHPDSGAGHGASQNTGLPPGARAVFQLVFAHPELDLTGPANPFSSIL
jgi:hypothetical protein